MGIKKLIKRIKKKFITRYYVFGDSHTEVFKYINENDLLNRKIFDVCLVGGATAQGMRNPNSKTDALNIFTKKIYALRKNERLIFQLGEVDTGFVIWYRAEKYKESIQTQLQESINQYIKFLSHLKENGFTNISVISAPLPTIEDNQTWGEIANLRKEIKATKLERTNLTLQYNKILQSHCSKLNINFLNTDNDLLNSSTNLVKTEFLNSDKNNHHLENLYYSKIILKFFND